MSVLTRTALEASPLADLHTIASELGIDGYRRLRKADLVDRIIEVQGGDAAEVSENGAVAEEEKPKRRRGTRGGRTRRKDADDDEAAEPEAEAAEVEEEEAAVDVDVDVEEPEVVEDGVTDEGDDDE